MGREKRWIAVDKCPEKETFEARLQAQKEAQEKFEPDMQRIEKQMTDGLTRLENRIGDRLLHYGIISRSRIQVMEREIRYSNCLLEAVKAWVRSPCNVKILCFLSRFLSSFGFKDMYASFLNILFDNISGREGRRMSKIVVVDPGHGLPDPGACGNNLQEYERVFALAQLVKNVLVRHGVQVFFTRTGEKSLSNAANLKQNKNQDIARRVQISRERNADFLLSLHMNSSGNPQSHGYETLCYSVNEQITALHNAVKTFVESKNIRDRGVKVRTDLGVLKGPRCKAALLECFFISNPKEAALMKDQVFLAGLAEAIGQGVLAAIDDYNQRSSASNSF
jgi:N-acetylmuramoyl-L-alanine amidase